MRTAVLIRGHARTWCLTRQNTIGLMSSIYGDNVDWYFVAPATHSVSRESIENDFVGANLRRCLLLDETKYPLPEDGGLATKWRTFIPAYWKLAWLDYHVWHAKREIELAERFRYDNVLFIRTDCWYFRVGAADAADKPLHPMSVSHIGISGDMGMDDWVSDDLVWRAGSSAADLLCLRWFDAHANWKNGNLLIHGNSHALLAGYVVRNFIAFDHGASGFRCTIMRPDHADQMPWSWDKHEDEHNDSRTWHGRPNAEKREWCRRLGIDPRDYQIPLID